MEQSGDYSSPSSSQQSLASPTWGGGWAWDGAPEEIPNGSPGAVARETSSQQPFAADPSDSSLGARHIPFSAYEGAAAGCPRRQR